MSGRIPPRPPRGPPEARRAERARPLAGRRAERPAEEGVGPDHFDPEPEPGQGRAGGEAQAGGARGARGERLARQLPARLLQGRSLSAADVEQLVRHFAAAVGRDPGSSRRARARLLTRTLLRRRGLSAFLGSLSGEEMERLCAHVGDALEGSPLLSAVLGEADDPPEETTP